MGLRGNKRARTFKCYFKNDIENPTWIPAIHEHYTNGTHYEMGWRVRIILYLINRWLPDYQDKENQ